METCNASSYVISLIEEFNLSGKTYIVTKLACGGDLVDYMVAHDINRFPEDHARQIFVQIAGGVKDIHDSGIVHRDLKQLNIFLSDQSETPKVKIGDFGFACKLLKDECIIKNCGTGGYIAPEII